MKILKSFTTEACVTFVFRANEQLSEDSEQPSSTKVLFECRNDVETFSEEIQCQALAEAIGQITKSGKEEAVRKFAVKSLAVNLSKEALNFALTKKLAEAHDAKVLREVALNIKLPDKNRIEVLSKLKTLGDKAVLEKTLVDIFDNCNLSNKLSHAVLHLATLISPSEDFLVKLYRHSRNKDSFDWVEVFGEVRNPRSKTFIQLKTIFITASLKKAQTESDVRYFYNIRPNKKQSELITKRLKQVQGN